MKPGLSKDGIRHFQNEQRNKYQWQKPIHRKEMIPFSGTGKLK